MSLGMPTLIPAENFQYEDQDYLRHSEQESALQAHPWYQRRTESIGKHQLSIAVVVE